MLDFFWMCGSVNIYIDNECICLVVSVLNFVVFVGLGDEVIIGILVLFGFLIRNDLKFIILFGIILFLIFGFI